MGDISPHLSRWEIACKGLDCCFASAPIDSALVAAFEEYRDVLGGFPIEINSGFRCHKHNRNLLNSSPKSQHCLGKALDLALVDGFTPQEMAAVAEEVETFRQGGIFIYSWGIHVDVRNTGKSRWSFV